MHRQMKFSADIHCLLLIQSNHAHTHRRTLLCRKLTLSIWNIHVRRIFFSPSRISALATFSSSWDNIIHKTQIEKKAKGKQYPAASVCMLTYEIILSNEQIRHKPLLEHKSCQPKFSVHTIYQRWRSATSGQTETIKWLRNRCCISCLFHSLRQIRCKTETDDNFGCFRIQNCALANKLSICQKYCRFCVL